MPGEERFDADLPVAQEGLDEQERRRRVAEARAEIVKRGLTGDMLGDPNFANKLLMSGVKSTSKPQSASLESKLSDLFTPPSEKTEPPKSKEDIAALAKIKKQQEALAKFGMLRMDDSGIVDAPAGAGTKPAGRSMGGGAPAAPMSEEEKEAAWLKKGWDPRLMPLKPETMRQQDALFGRERQLLETRAKTEAREAEIALHAADEKALYARETARQLQENEAARKDMLEKKKAELMTTQHAIQNYEFEPNRAWEKAGTGTKAAMVIGGILQGFLAGMQGRQAQSFDKQIDGLLEYDRAKQRAGFEKLERSDKATRQRLADYEAISGSQRAGTIQSEMDKIAALQAETMRSAQELYGGKYENIPAAYKQRLDALMLNLDGRMNQLAGQRDQAMFVGLQRPMGGGGGGKQPQGSIVQLFPEGDESVGRSFLVSPEEAKEIHKKQAAVTDITNLADRIIKYRESPSAYATAFGIPLTEAAGDVQTLAGQLLFKVNAAQESGVMQEGDAKRIKEMIGDPNSILSRSSSKLKLLKQTTKGIYNSAVMSTGGEEVTRNYKKGPGGDVRPDTKYAGGHAQSILVPPSTFKKVGTGK